MQTIDFMPDRLNAEPTVFRGFTTHEMFAAAGVGCVGGSVISIPLLPLAGWVILPTGALIMPLLVVFFGGTFLTRIKRGKPENYLYRRLSWKLQTGFARTLPLTGRLTEKYPHHRISGMVFTPDAGAVTVPVYRRRPP